MIFGSFFMGVSQKFPRCSKNNSSKRWIIFLKNYHSHPKEHQFPNELKSFSMTQKTWEIDVMVYNMTKNPKIYKKIFLVTVLEN